MNEICWNNYHTSKVQRCKWFPRAKRKVFNTIIVLNLTYWRTFPVNSQWAYQSYRISIHKDVTNGGGWHRKMQVNAPNLELANHIFDVNHLAPMSPVGWYRLFLNFVNRWTSYFMAEPPSVPQSHARVGDIKVNCRYPSLLMFRSIILNSQGIQN